MDTQYIADVVFRMNGKEVKSDIAGWRRELKLAETEKKKLEQSHANGETWTEKEVKAMARYTKTIQQCRKKLDESQTSSERLKQSLETLDKTNPVQLQRTLKTLEASLKKAVRGSRDWDELTDAIRHTKAELQKVKEETKALEETGIEPPKSFKDQFAAWGRKWQGVTTIASAATGAISSAYSSMQSYVNDYAEMAEHMANVTKYTGLAADDVEELNEAFKSMDTRTSREALNDLAADAGRLGIQSKQEVLDFVQAADQINVALGEDLGEDAVKNIGKLAQMFGDADSMGLKKAMLATGSTINELAQSSSASEGYLMDFTQRLAGVGKQAGMTQAQIMGLGSVLDQNSVQAEVAATALSKILQKLYQDPAQMARAAGLDVKEFTNLLKTDANAALIQFAKGMNNLGGMEGMAPVLKDLSITGDGVSRTLMTIAQNTEAVTATQQQATQAFQEATSVTNEFNAQNNTVQAQLEKQQKRFHDLSVELGATLFPILNAGLSIFNTLVSVLRTLFIFIGNNIGKISLFAAAIAALTIIVNYQNIAFRVQYALIVAQGAVTNAWAVAMGVATKALNALKIAMAKNPWTLAITLVTSLTASIYLLCTRTKELTAAEREEKQLREDLDDLHEKAKENLSEEYARIVMLNSILHDNRRSLNERREALEELKRIIPGYNAYLTEEGNITRENTKALNDYIAKLQQAALQRAAEAKLQEIGSEMLPLNEQQNDLNDRLAANRKKQAAYGDTSLLDMAITTDRYGRYMQRRNVAHVAQDYTDLHGGSAHAFYEKLKDYIALKDEETSLQDQLATVYVNQGKVQKRLDQITNASSRYYTAGNMGGNGGGGGNGSGGGSGSGGSGGGTHYESKAERKEREKREREAAKQARKEEQERKKQQKKQIAEIQENEAQQRAAADAAFQAGFIDADAHRQKILDIERDALTQKRDLYEEGTTDYIRYNEKLLELDEKQSVKQRDWSITDLKRQEQEELAAAEERHYKELTSEEQWEADKERITLKYLDRRARYYQYYGDAENFEKTITERQQELHNQQLKKLKWFYDEVKKLQEKAKTDLSPVAQYQSEMGEVEAQLTAGLISYEDYMKKKMAIDAKYLTAQLQGDGKGKDGKGKNGKGEGKDGEENTYELKLVANSDGFSSSLVNCFQAFQALNEKIKSEGGATWQDYAAAAEVALSAVMSGMSAFSSYYQAAQQAEEAKVTAKYDAEIEAAGSSTAKGKKLEEKKQKELAAIKSKYNKKQQAMEIAQAVASTAMAAINAYASASKVSWILGPIAAAAALAAGAIQIATIKKQHEAEAAGYYEGGYTGNVGERKVAGVVHGGEFVMNARAVSNPALAPVLSLIDHAQRNNTVASLTPDQVSAAVIAPQRTARATLLTADSAALAAEQTAALQSAQSSLAVVASQASAEQTAVSRDTATQLRRLADQLDAGITAVAAIDGTGGIANQLRRYNRMKSH